MDSLFEVIRKKAKNLDDSQRTDIHLAQVEINRLYPTSTIKVDGIKDGTIFLHTQSAPFASELRIQQFQLLQVLNSTTKTELLRIRILIR